MGTGARLIIVCGLPGSGKSTLAKRLEKDSDGLRLSPDDWMEALAINLHDEQQRGRIEALQWEVAQNLLTTGLTVIIEWGTWAKSERDALRIRARELGAAVELRYLAESPDVLLDRVRRRGNEDPPIERDAVERWMEIFEEPTTEELALYDRPAGNAGQ